VRRLLAGVEAPWYVAAGSAIEAVVPRLEPERRRWLAEALELVHPGHPWLAELG